jgi:hypothetical protein
MAYLQKMIDCISNTLGEQVLAKPAKVRTWHHQCKHDHHQQTVGALLTVALQMLLTTGAMLQIVAGLEPEQTNLFLQMLARAAAQTVQVTQSTSLMQKLSILLRCKHGLTVSVTKVQGASSIQQSATLQTSMPPAASEPSSSSIMPETAAMPPKQPVSPLLQQTQTSLDQQASHIPNNTHCSPAI